MLILNMLTIDMNTLVSLDSCLENFEHLEWELIYVPGDSFGVMMSCTIKIPRSDAILQVLKLI